VHFLVGRELSISIPSKAQSIPTAGPQLGRIMGVITDVNGDGAAGATVILLGPDSFGRQKVVSQENGFFLLGSLEPGISYQISRRGAENSQRADGHHPF
jgi:hypothetical protein